MPVTRLDVHNRTRITVVLDTVRDRNSYSPDSSPPRVYTVVDPKVSQVKEIGSVIRQCLVNEHESLHRKPSANSSVTLPYGSCHLVLDLPP